MCEVDFGRGLKPPGPPFRRGLTPTSPGASLRAGKDSVVIEGGRGQRQVHSGRPRQQSFYNCLLRTGDTICSLGARGSPASFARSTL